jgi:hypothetical protein
MYCIFCKRDSTDSKSIEHIIPESLGNTIATLPRGVVCDKCNNYFSRNVERPFLESEAVRTLRFQQAIPSKKGRIPSIEALLLPGFSSVIHRPKNGPYIGLIGVEPGAMDYLATTKTGKFVLKLPGNPPDLNVVSRFLAKVALEALAERLMTTPGGIEYLINEQQFDPIRRYAREGYPAKWPHVARRIYTPNRTIERENGVKLQTVWEYRFLQTPQSGYMGSDSINMLN